MFRKYFRRFFSSKKKEKKRKNYMGVYSIDYKIFDTNTMINIHKYLMKKHDIKQCLG